MSNFEPLRQAITNHFKTAWGDPGVPPVAYDNHAFRQPDGPWGRFACRMGTRAPAAIGRHFARTPGFVVLQMFVKENAGTKAAVVACDAFAEIYDHKSLRIYQEGVHVGDVQFELAERKSIGKTGDGWWQENALCNFRFDEISIITLARVDIFLEEGSVQLQTTVFP